MYKIRLWSLGPYERRKDDTETHTVNRADFTVLQLRDNCRWWAWNLLVPNADGPCVAIEWNE